MRQWNVDRPRLLHASAHTVFLVGAVYVCEYGHQILSTDPRILMLIPDHLIPVLLTLFDSYCMCEWLCARLVCVCVCVCVCV